MSVVAKVTARVAGFRAMVQKGKVYDEGDPVVKANPDLFESPESFAERTAKPKDTAEMGARSMSARHIERATKEPGEKRQVRRKGADGD